MSVNTIFPHLNEQVYKRYKKTVPYIITGNRPDPENVRNRIGFVIQTPQENFDIETGSVTTFDADEETIEVYSAAEDKVFRKENAALFNQGLLVPYESKVSIEVTSINELTDTEIEAIAKIKNLPQFKKRVLDLSETSKRRVLESVRKLNRPSSFERALEND